MRPDLRRDLMVALERPHRLGTIGGDLEEQLAHSASFSSVLASVLGELGITNPARGVDLGTGGGLPGVVLAGLWPAMSWLLVDMRAARATEVERTVLRLGFSDRVDVYAVEAQHLGHDPTTREQFDVAVARAFGPSSITAECAAGLVRPGGAFLISEPPEAVSEEERWNEDGLMRLGFALPRFINDAGHRFAAFEKVSAAPATIPRMPPRANRGWPHS